LIINAVSYVANKIMESFEDEKQIPEEKQKINNLEEESETSERPNKQVETNQ
jgi:hypothetical protein